VVDSFPDSALSGQVTPLNVAQPLIQASLVGEAIDAGPVLIFVADEKMQYVAVNEYACATLGYEREELLALGVSDVVVGSDTTTRYRRFMRDGAMAGTSTLRRKDGTELRYTYRAQPTTVAGMALYVSAGWTVDGADL
jgi:PAS domain S-box-containing protein